MVAVILAGGRSRRTAPVDKLQLRHVDLEAMLARVMRSVCPQLPRVLVAPRWRWRGLSRLGLPEARWVADPDEGPWRALRAASAGPVGWLMVLPGDLPRPSPSLHRRLWEARGPDIDAVTAAGPRGFQLPMVLRAELCGPEGPRSFRQGLRGRRLLRLDPRHLTSAERAGLVDVDRLSVARRHGLACAVDAAIR